MYRCLLAGVVIALLAPGSLLAADTPTVPDGPPIGAPGGAYDPITVSDYLTKCANMGSSLSSADGKLCSFPLDMEVAVDRQNKPGTLCVKALPGDSPEIFNAVMAWLKARPELKNSSKEEGAYLALTSLYACPHP